MTPSEIAGRLTDSPFVMERMDRVFGLGGWDERYEVEGGAVVRCTVQACRDESRLIGNGSAAIVHRDDASLRTKLAFRRALHSAAIDLGIDELVYANVPGFVGYRVGLDASVWSRWRPGWRGITPDWQRMRPTDDGRGYMQVKLQSGGVARTFKLHLLVLLSFYGPKPRGMVGRHLSGNQLDNRPENLSYGTQHDNMLDRSAHGRTCLGESVGSAKLTAEQVLAIRRRAGAGEKQKDLAVEFGVGKWMVNQIVCRHYWTHLEDDR